MLFCCSHCRWLIKFTIISLQQSVSSGHVLKMFKWRCHFRIEYYRPIRFWFEYRSFTVTKSDVTLDYSDGTQINAVAWQYMLRWKLIIAIHHDRPWWPTTAIKAWGQKLQNRGSSEASGQTSWHQGRQSWPGRWGHSLKASIVVDGHENTLNR